MVQESAQFWVSGFSCHWWSPKSSSYTIYGKYCCYKWSQKTICVKIFVVDLILLISWLPWIHKKFSLCKAQAMKFFHGFSSSNLLQNWQHIDYILYTTTFPTHLRNSKAYWLLYMIWSASSSLLTTVIMCAWLGDRI